MHCVFGKGMTGVVNVRHVWKIPHMFGKSLMCAENPTCVWKNTQMKECLVYLETSWGRPSYKIKKIS